MEVPENNASQDNKAQNEPLPPPSEKEEIPKNPTPNKEFIRKKKTFKIIVIGDTGVGKTCLTYRFCSGKFPSTPTDATIGVDFREKLITLDSNEQVYLENCNTCIVRTCMTYITSRSDFNYGTRLVKKDFAVAW